MESVFGKKLSMTQRYDENGALKTVTRVFVQPHTVTGIKSQDKHGYSALQIGVGSLRKAPKALTQVYNGTVPGIRKEIRKGDLNHEVGAVIAVSDVLKAGDLVRVIGYTKGKGFTGVVKRHGFAGGPKTHGQSDRHRAPGSIGAGTTMGRVLKGLRMAGRSGNEQAAVRNLTVMYVREDGTVYLSGPIPGHLGSLVKLEKMGENKKFSPMILTKEDELDEKEEVITNKEEVEAHTGVDAHNVASEEVTVEENA